MSTTEILLLAIVVELAIFFYVANDFRDLLRDMTQSLDALARKANEGEDR